MSILEFKNTSVPFGPINFDIGTAKAVLEYVKNHCRINQSNFFVYIGPDIGLSVACR